MSVFAAEVPALPSGYSGLPRELVAASQRQRLVHGVTIAVAEKGFATAAITDISAAGGVSKKTFYEHFDSKAACFLAAYDHGSAALLAATAQAAADARAAGASAVDQLRAGTRAYLAFLVDEAPYARTFCLEMLAAGPEAIARHRACRQAFTGTLATWDALNHPDRPPRSPLAYEAATAVVYELSCARVADGRAHELPGLEDELIAAQLAILSLTA